ncbi:hypothetical protein GMD78_12190 [Ornithinibacillus sp. L9]|uniref:Phage protein n=1 Tax=Ornithinibacillus caprae TaxID=2678566 RepID=A0A6N8FI78_9BACI|nr:hypothetical protein [Ornithinibacillus caprae]MUK89133.1 hypothetical protein [Ornithinibacillus caprae]
MIKEAMQYVLSLGKAEIHEVNGQQYSDKDLYVLREPVASPFEVHTLTSLVEYVKSNFDTEEELMIHVENPTRVSVSSALNIDQRRDEYLVAEALTPRFRFDNWYDTEEFNIKLQSVFVNNEDRKVILKLVGNIKEDNVKTFGDDGVSQSVVARTGVASVGNVEVPNPVTLAPFRTFTEIAQPESDFVFRMQKGPSCALFEADGGAWKIHAIDQIKEYLNAELSDKLAEGTVTIIG